MRDGGRVKKRAKGRGWGRNVDREIERYGKCINRGYER